MSVFQRVRMPSLDGATGWVKSDPLGRAELRGHVVLVNFWTLTWINWLRQEPYVRAWSQAHRDAVVSGPVSGKEAQKVAKVANAALHRRPPSLARGGGLGSRAATGASAIRAGGVEREHHVLERGDQPMALVVA